MGEFPRLGLRRLAVAVVAFGAVTATAVAPSPARDEPVDEEIAAPVDGAGAPVPTPTPVPEAPTPGPEDPPAAALIDDGLLDLIDDANVAVVDPRSWTLGNGPVAELADVRPDDGDPLAASPGNLSPVEIYGVARQVGFDPETAVIMTAIAMAESGGNPAAHNGNGEDSWGLWQINRDAHAWSFQMDLTNPIENARAAWRVSREGATFVPWSVTHANRGAPYLAFLGVALAAAELYDEASGIPWADQIEQWEDQAEAGNPPPVPGGTPNPAPNPGNPNPTPNPTPAPTPPPTARPTPSNTGPGSGSAPGGVSDVAVFITHVCDGRSANDTASCIPLCPADGSALPGDAPCAPACPEPGPGVGATPDCVRRCPANARPSDPVVTGADGLAPCLPECRINDANAVVVRARCVVTGEPGLEGSGPVLPTPPPPDPDPDPDPDGLEPTPTAAALPEAELTPTGVSAPPTPDPAEGLADVAG
jgi:hypothetical protein